MSCFMANNFTKAYLQKGSLVLTGVTVSAVIIKVIKQVFYSWKSTISLIAFLNAEFYWLGRVDFTHVVKSTYDIFTLKRKSEESE